MPIDPTRGKEVLIAALAITDPIARSAFLDRQCDAELRSWVDDLLRASANPASGIVESAVSPEAVTEPDETLLRPPESPTLTFSPDANGTQDLFEKSPGSADEFSPTRTYSGAPPNIEGSGANRGLIAGRYRIVEEIGQGGMGSVYLARQSTPVKRDVALKLIKKGADSRAVVARFEAERQALALMDHPNIASVYDGGTTPDGQPYFVMELVRGQPITEYCDDHRLTLSDRLELFVQVCRAVQHAHQKGIIHRDLKPGNILVTEVDGRPTPKVIDFGVAKAIDQRLTDSSFSDEGAIVGTPAYMSPEQTDPTGVDIDTRTDVYALGVVLYELLAGSPPISMKDFRRGAILEMLRMVREIEPEHLSTKASSAEALPDIAAKRGVEPARLLTMLRGDVDWIVLKALEKDRDRRYESANGMAADILRYLADEPIVARPPTRGYRLKKFIRRNRGPVLASALIALALVMGVIGVVWQWREAVHQRTVADLARLQADEQRKLAETSSRVALEQRKVALEAVGQMVTTVRTELSKKPDLQGVLKQVLSIAQRSLDNIAQNPLVDISLNDTTRAAAHDATARMHRDTGDTVAALKEFTMAADIYRAILDRAAEGPDKEVVKKNLLIVWISLGQTSLRTGTQADARAYYEKAEQLIGRLDPKTAADYRKILISLYSSLGAVTIDIQPREARAIYLKALGIAGELADREIAETGRRSDDTSILLVHLYILIGGADGKLRDTKSRESYYAKARAIADELAKAAPGDKGRIRPSALVHERTGDALLRTDKPADAAKEYASAAEFYKEIADSDPKNVDARADLARGLYNRGLAAQRNGDKNGAAELFQKSLVIRKARANLKAEAYAQRDLMMSLAHVGSHRDATELAETARAKLPEDPGALVDIACCYAVCSATVPAGADKETHDRYAKLALAALALAIDALYGDKVNLETEPDLDALRILPEFKALVNRIPEP